MLIFLKRGIMDPYDWWEEQQFYDFDLYIVTMLDHPSGILLDRPWPVFAGSFEAAMTTYEVLAKWAAQRMIDT